MNGKDSIKIIKTLPVKISLDSNITKLYAEERKKISTGKQLKAFTKRWVAVWKIPWAKYWSPHRLEKQIISNRYDAKRVLDCIVQNSTDNNRCYHIGRSGDCISANILAPFMLIQIVKISEMYGVPQGVALSQLQRYIFPDIRDMDPYNILGTNT